MILTPKENGPRNRWRVRFVSGPNSGTTTALVAIFHCVILYIETAFGSVSGKGKKLHIKRSADKLVDPYAVHFGMITASDLILVNEAGKPLTPTKHKVNRAGFMIHGALHKARPDINAACHTHSPYGRAWSAFGRPIEMLNQDCCYLYNDLAVYAAFGGVAFDAEEGENIAKALGAVKKNVILQNHGYAMTLEMEHQPCTESLLTSPQYFNLWWHRWRSHGIFPRARACLPSSTLG